MAGPRSSHLLHPLNTLHIHKKNSLHDRMYDILLKIYDYTDTHKLTDTQVVPTPTSEADPIPYICINLSSFYQRPCGKPWTEILTNGEFIIRYRDPVKAGSGD